MKKNYFFILLFIFIVFISGCKNEKTKEIIKEEVMEPAAEEEVLPSYIDANNTPISFYTLQGNKLIKLTEITKHLNVEEDIGLFQIFPSNENEILLNKSFGETFFEEWNKYNTNNNLKIGINIKFSLAGEEISYNIFGPENTFEKWEYLMNYLYDDYANRGKGFYSHIEENDYNENTLFTAFKMQSSYNCNEIISPIQVTVFTYDTLDDFDNNEYRGNSHYTFIINTQ